MYVTPASIMAEISNHENDAKVSQNKAKKLMLIEKAKAKIISEIENAAKNGERFTLFNKELCFDVFESIDLIRNEKIQMFINEELASNGYEIEYARKSSYPFKPTGDEPIQYVKIKW